MKKVKIFTTVTFVLLIFSSLGYALTYNIVLTKIASNVSFSSITILDSKTNASSTTGAYTLAVYSGKRETLLSTRFDFPEIQEIPPSDWFDKNGTQIKTGPLTSVESSFVQLTLPYFTNGQKMVILNNKTILAEKDISNLSSCNDNKICEPRLRENYKTCPSDCPSGSKDGFCDGASDYRCDSDCLTSQDPDCKLPEAGASANTTQNTGFPVGLLIIGTVTLLLIIGGLKLFKKI